MSSGKFFKTAGVKKYQKIIYMVILLIALFWCYGIIAAPVWSAKNDVRYDIAEHLYIFYSKSCHQIEERSFEIGGTKFGVCSRCTLIYFGFLLGTLIYPLIRKLNNNNLPPIWILFIGVGLVAIDAGLDIFSVIRNTFITREITGGVLGLILPFYIIPGAIRIFDEFFSPQKIIPK